MPRIDFLVKTETTLVEWFGLGVSSALKKLHGKNTLQKPFRTLSSPVYFPHWPFVRLRFFFCGKRREHRDEAHASLAEYPEIDDIAANLGDQASRTKTTVFVRVL